MPLWLKNLFSLAPYRCPGLTFLASLFRGRRGFGDDRAASLKKLDQGVGIFFGRFRRLGRETSRRRASFPISSGDGDEFHEFERDFVAALLVVGRSRFGA